MQMVSTEICRLKHEHTQQDIEQDRHRLDGHSAQLEALAKLAAQQTAAIESLLKRMEEVDERLKRLEQRPQRRVERVIETAFQWATLLVLGLLAARMGLG